MTGPVAATVATGPGPASMQSERYRPFWEGAEKGELRFPRCRGCGRFHWYPALRCPHCSSAALEWTAVGGEGRVFTWTVVRYPFLLEFKDRLPLIVALVEFDDAPGVRLVTNIVDARPEEMAVGVRVSPVFRRLTSGVCFPLYRPAGRPLAGAER